MLEKEMDTSIKTPSCHIFIIFKNALEKDSLEHLKIYIAGIGL